MADWGYVALGFVGFGAVAAGYALRVEQRIRRLRRRPSGEQDGA